MNHVNLAEALGITEDMDPDEVNERCIDAACRMDNQIYKDLKERFR